MTQSQTDLRNGPDANGLFGAFGGRYVAETLMPLILDLAREYEAAKEDPAFKEELAYFQRDYVGRPSPLYFAERLTEFCGGAKIYLKREELNHTGAHKINAVLGQILLAKRRGKTRVIAETGAGQHGVATATACALFDLPCTVFMGATDVERQKPNVFRMKLLGAEVENAGTIITAKGQTTLAAGDSFYIRKGVGTTGNDRSTTRGNEVATSLNAGSSAGKVTNSGLIMASTGDITLTGHQVQQNGVALASTSVDTRGTIHLLNSATDSTGSVTLGEGSTTAILLDSSGSTALNGQKDNGLIKQKTARPRT